MASPAEMRGRFLPTAAALHIFSVIVDSGSDSLNHLKDLTRK